MLVDCHKALVYNSDWLCVCQMTMKTLKVRWRWWPCKCTFFKHVSVFPPSVDCRNAVAWLLGLTTLLCSATSGWGITLSVNYYKSSHVKWTVLNILLYIVSNMQNAENITKFTPSFFLISTICKHLNRAELYPFFLTWVVFVILVKAQKQWGNTTDTIKLLINKLWM